MEKLEFCKAAQKITGISIALCEIYTAQFGTPVFAHVLPHS